MPGQVAHRELRYDRFRHGRQPGPRPTRHRAPLTVANCLKCARRQLQHLLVVPSRDRGQQGTIERHRGNTSLQQRHDLQQQLPEHPQQHHVGVLLQELLQQPHPQLAYADCFSNKQRTCACNTESPFTNQHVLIKPQHDQATQQYVSMTATNHDGVKSPPAAGSDNPMIDGLPPLSNLVNQPSSSPAACHPQQQGTAVKQPGMQARLSAGAATDGAESSSDCGLNDDDNCEKAAVSNSGVGQHAGEESAGVKAALAMLKGYKSVLSPMMQSTCRFLPTCSQYSMDSYRSYGVAKGTVLTAWRLLRCNPWGRSGYDPTQWPPPGLAWLFQYQYSAEVAVVVGTGAFIRLAHALLFE